MEARAGDARVAELLAPLEDADTRTAVSAERALNAALGGSCTVPIGAWCMVGERGLSLYGMVGDTASGRLLRASAEAATSTPERLGQSVAADLLAQGAGALLGR